HARYTLPLHDALPILAGIVLPGLLDHVERVEFAHVAQDDVAGGAGRLDHDIDDRFLHGARPVDRWIVHRTKAPVWPAPRKDNRSGQPRTAPDMNGPAANLRIVLVGTQHPGHLGSAARDMTTMGPARPHPD